jgi:hypothetical protein
MPKRSVKKPREAIEARWGVYALRSKARRVGSVKAKNKDEALKRAFQECHVAESDRHRITVWQES